MDVHHVASFVVGDGDVVHQRWVYVEVGQGVFGGEEGRGQVEVAVGDEPTSTPK